MIGQDDDAPGAVNYLEWARVLDINTMGPVRVLDAFADRLAAAGSAKALTLTSGLGSIGDVGSGRSMMYRTSKAAVNMAMRARALQLAPRGIVVAVINRAGSAPTWAGPAPRSRPRRASTAMRGIIEADAGGRRQLPQLARRQRTPGRERLPPDARCSP